MFLLRRIKATELKFWEIIVLPSQKLGEVFLEEQKEPFVKHLQEYFGRYTCDYKKLVDDIYEKIKR